MKASSIWSLIAAALLAVAVLFIARGIGTGEEAPADAKPAGGAGARESKSEGARPEAKARETREVRKTDSRVENIRVDGTYESNLVGDMLLPFDPEELKQLAAQPGRDQRRLTELILRAAAEKDGSFGDLPGREELRGDPAVETALLIYDYAVNGNGGALQKVLQRHDEAADGNRRSWDTNEIWALSYIGEWELTRQALASRLLSGDGTGGDARYAFWLRRRFLFPQDKSFPDTYEAFQEEIIAAQKANDPEGMKEVGY